jgi:hypothetical protein
VGKQRSRLGSKQEWTGDGDGNNEDGAAWSAGLPLCFLHFHLHLAALLSVHTVSVAFYCEISMTQEVKTTSHKTSISGIPGRVFLCCLFLSQPWCELKTRQGELKFHELEGRRWSNGNEAELKFESELEFSILLGLHINSCSVHLSSL